MLINGEELRVGMRYRVDLRFDDNEYGKQGHVTFAAVLISLQEVPAESPDWPNEEGMFVSSWDNGVILEFRHDESPFWKEVL